MIGAACIANAEWGGADVTRLEIIAIGCAGGVIPDLIRFAKARYETNIADYFKHWNFWLGLAGAGRARRARGGLR